MFLRAGTANVRKLPTSQTRQPLTARSAPSPKRGTERIPDCLLPLDNTHFALQFIGVGSLPSVPSDPHRVVLRLTQNT